MDYTKEMEAMVFHFYAIFGSFPASGPAAGFKETTLEGHCCPYCVNPNIKALQTILSDV